MSNKKLPLEQRKWKVLDGSIYAADTDKMYSDGAKKIFHIFPSIAFNVGDTLANHIVGVHNRSIGQE